MRKVYAFIIAMAIITTALMFIPHGNSNGLAIGEKIENQLVSSPKNHLVLINFWASYDAASREENVRFSQVLGKYEQNNYGLTSVSVSLDDYENLFREIVKKDDLNFTKVVREKKGFDSKLAKDFRLERHFGNFIVDQRGNIVAKDITPEQLEKKLQRGMK
jgi:thiol-disulfide isomerase/thioredoxin